MERSVVFTGTGEKVAVDLVYLSPGLQGGLETTSIELVPKQPLAEGWYTLEVDEPEPPLVWRSLPTSAFELRDGIGRTRFRVGSAPRLLTVNACDKADAITAFYFYISEEVLAAEPVQDHVFLEANGERVSCEQSLATAGPDYLRVACKLDGADALRISLDDAFRSVENPAQPLAAATITLDVSVSAGLTFETGCKTFKLPLTLD